MHYLLNHFWVFVGTTALVSVISGAVGGMLFSLVIEPHTSVVAATGTWAIGIIGAISTWYYFQVDHKRDISVRFTPKIVDYKDKADNKMSKVIFTLQAYNDSRIGNVVSAQRIYVTTKEPGYSEISNDYSKRLDRLPFIKINNTLVSKNYQEYYSLQPYGITPNLTFEHDAFINSVSEALPINLKGNKQEECWLAFVFADVKDDPYIYISHFEF